MTKNRQKAKYKVINNMVIGEVMVDIITLHCQMTGTDPVSVQYVKNLVGLLKTRYRKQLEGMPKEDISKQIDLEDAIKSIKAEQQ